MAQAPEPPPEPSEHSVDWSQVVIGVIFMAIGVGLCVLGVKTASNLEFWIGIANIVLGVAKMIRGGIGYERGAADPP